MNAAIAYNVWQYYQATGDVEFLRFYGAEMILEIARFWSSLATYNPGCDRYEIRGVMGPDEYHDAYPERPRTGPRQQRLHQRHGGLGAARARRGPRRCSRARARQELRERLELDDEELDRWDDISRKMYVPLPRRRSSASSRATRSSRSSTGTATGEVRRHPAARPHPRGRGRHPNRYKVAKQADVLMLFYLSLGRRAGGAARAARLRRTTTELVPRTSTTTTPGPRTARR